MANPFRNRSGIYCILHIASGKRYIGQAQDIAGRWSVHIATLKKGTHHCEHLQRAWNKYGANAFVFRALRFSPLESLDEHEALYFNRSRGLLYNTKPPGKSCRGFKHKPEVIAKMREAAGRCARSIGGRQQRSENAKRMHEQGRIPKRPIMGMIRICNKCGKEFKRSKLLRGGHHPSRFCLGCRTETVRIQGGRIDLDILDIGMDEWDDAAYELTSLREYKYNRVLLGEEGRPKQKYKGA